jgi:hypothetical protein
MTLRGTLRERPQTEVGRHNLPHAEFITICLSDDCRPRVCQQLDDGRVER